MKARYIFIISLALVLAGLYLVGRNNTQAQTLVNSVANLDQANQSTTQALALLESFSRHHMGASASVFLAGAYNHDQAAANATSATGQVYHDAQAACVSRTSAVNQANCVQQYVAAHSQPGSSSIQAPQLDKTKYTHSFKSPPWTPDLAGILLLLGLIGFIGGGVKVIHR